MAKKRPRGRPSRLQKKEFLRRSRAAKKGWEARRLRAARRSAAARKGWETRRKRPKRGGLELRSKTALVCMVAKLPPGEARTQAHRALWDRLLRPGAILVLEQDWIDLFVSVLGWDWERALDLLYNYH